MLPTLFTWGSIRFPTLAVVTFFAMLVGAFVFWRKTRQENYPEASVFDGWILAQMFGLVMARLAFVGLHFDQFSWQMWDWLNWWGKPGLFVPVSLLASAWYLWRFAKKNKWDEFELLDFWSLGAVATWFLLFCGFFLDGSFVGMPANLPWSVMLPGMVEKTHPASLYAAGGMLLTWWYLSWTEFRYRTFDWYRAGKQTAQTGFLFSVWLIGFGAIATAISFVRLPEMMVQLWSKNWALDPFFYGSIFIFGVISLWVRSGRTFGFSAKKKLRVS